MRMLITMLALGFLATASATFGLLAGKGLTSGSGSWGGNGLLGTNRTPRICVIRMNRCNWNSIVPVCARMGQSNLCKRFQNNCQFQTANCGTTPYTLVNNSMCANLATNAQGMCNGLNTGVIGGSGLGGVGMGSGIFSGNIGGTTSNITPIIIRRRG